jgi:hypothetical protein
METLAFIGGKVYFNSSYRLCVDIFRYLRNIASYDIYNRLSQGCNTPVSNRLEFLY